MTGKLIGIIGSGLIGINPFDSSAWSGSSKFFFDECSRAGILARAFGVEVPKYKRLPMMLKNFSVNLSRWKHKFYLDVSYYQALTKEIERRLSTSDRCFDMLQIGGIYNVSELIKGESNCYSYHDGNLAGLLRSPYMPKRIPKKIIKRALEYELRTYENMTMIFTMSEYLRHSFIEDFGISESKVKNIGAGINLSHIPPPGKSDYSSQEVLFIGVEFYRKGGAQLLEAFRIVKQNLPSAKLHIIGPTRLKIASDLSNGVEFHGYLSKRNPDQIKKFNCILSKCSLFVLPSLYEPFGIAPLEAMVHEMPCILTDRWAFSEMVRPGFNGYLVPCGNVEALSEKMILMLSNEDLLKEMGKAGRKFVLENYTWDIVVQKLIKEINAKK